MRAELNPHRAWKIRKGKPEVFIKGAIPWKPRQELPEAYQLNGAVYAFDMDKLTKNKTVSLLFGKQGAVLMSEERSLDIDDDLDFKIAEHRLKKVGM